MRDLTALVLAIGFLAAPLSSALAAEPPGADLTKPLTARPPPDPEEITITGKSRFQLEIENHRRELQRLQGLFPPPENVESVRDRYLGGQNIMDTSTWEKKGGGVDPVRAGLFEKVTSEAVRGRSQP
jgi:hypothetical protein